ncbi:NADPH-dependent ferric siderophore reductase, contains FAD-binding and SIP domains [Nocardioides scoriae]|uniref:NADPH-dependent ferric siderophore reductase, contains FAD-binding and SIP domains n=1 Tax=Nocardioides scoriae TaxID=642780 RepID=A0A1H1WFJ4_9ACTN|nr:siderophore-interacting protein [Nocardioides scoriae]SDS95805.1 NADPH-dependent ferric siderophore reductase, contains FAD-binding and SIP domains [Nocardioides scoriae]
MSTAPADTTTTDRTDSQPASPTTSGAAGEAALPMVLTTVEAVEVTRLSPSYVRVCFAGDLADLGVDGPWLDQRIKLVLPEEHGVVPSVEGVGADWYAGWRALPPEQRGHMRTYTVRDVQGYGADTRLVVDFVVHEDGLAGPGGGWALRARPGMRIVLVAPRRGVPFGGIEFTPGAATSLLLVGDETAVPAVAGILAGLGCAVTGTAFLEVPDALDIQDLPAPPGVEVRWLVRGHRDVGARLVPAVRECLGLPASAPGDDHVEVDPDLWETPAFSSSGEEVATQAHNPASGPLDGVFAWIAGESTMVTRLRRALVREVGVDRRQVAFMGYWRRGVAMQS